MCDFLISSHSWFFTLDSDWDHVCKWQSLSSGSNGVNPFFLLAAMPVPSGILLTTVTAVFMAISFLGAMPFLYSKQSWWYCCLTVIRKRVFSMWYLLGPKAWTMCAPIPPISVFQQFSNPLQKKVMGLFLIGLQDVWFPFLVDPCSIVTFSKQLFDPWTRFGVISFCQYSLNFSTYR